MNCFCGTRRLPRPPLFSLSWSCLISRRQNGGSLTVAHKQRISERLRVGFSVEGLFLRSFFVFLCCVLALFFSQNAVFCCPQDVAENVFDLPEEPSRLPCLPKKCPPTPQINTQFGFFHSIQSPSHRLFLYTFDGQLFFCFVFFWHHSNRLPKWNLLAGFIRIQQKATWMRSESESSASSSSPRK